MIAVLPDARLRLLLIAPATEAAFEAVAGALAGGVRAVMLRDKTASPRALLRHALALRAATREHGALLLINGRVDVAAACEADGVHLGAREMPAVQTRRLLGERAIIGYSAHLGDAPEAWAAAGYVTFSPVFASPGKGPPVGLAALAAFAREAAVPVLALGGVTADNAASALRHGAAGVAVIREILEAPSSAQAAGRLRTLVEEMFDGAKSGG